MTLLLLAVSASAYTDKQIYDMKQLRLLAGEVRAKIVNSKNSIEKLESEYKDLQKERRSLAKKYIGSKSSNKYEKRRKETMRLDDKMIKVKEEIEDLESKIEQLMKQYEILGHKYKKIKESK